MSKIHVGHRNMTSQNLHLNMLRLVPHTQNTICFPISVHIFIILEYFLRNMRRGKSFGRLSNPGPVALGIFLFLPSLFCFSIMPVHPKRNHSFPLFFLILIEIVWHSSFPCVLCYMIEWSVRFHMQMH